MRGSALVFFLCLILTAATASAVMMALTTDEITKSSDIVIRGTVQRVESYWSDDGKSIMSRATVLVIEKIRGRIVPHQVVVEYAGGEIGDLGYRVSDSVSFEEGEDTLLFLRGPIARNKPVQAAPGSQDQLVDQPEGYEMVGKAQGKYTIDHLGIARKRGFSVVGKPGTIDNNIPVEELIRKIKEADK
ncbi:MAG: hypothetical protein RBS57_17970 [Desulforhabdus sp.]|nr:hypothetical protein [Desulforhabdus sp.]